MNPIAAWRMELIFWKNAFRAQKTLQNKSDCVRQIGYCYLHISFLKGGGK